MDEELLFCPQIVSKLLSPSYVVFGKVIFSLLSVCLFTGGPPCDHYSWHHSPVWDASTTIDWFKLVHLGPHHQHEPVQTCSHGTSPCPLSPLPSSHTHTHTHTHTLCIYKQVGDWPSTERLSFFQMVSDKASTNQTTW